MIAEVLVDQWNRNVGASSNIGKSQTDDSRRRTLFTRSALGDVVEPAIPIPSPNGRGSHCSGMQ